MAEKIVLRRDTAANWTASNPVLALGELALEYDTLKWKVGDGSTTWNSLGYNLDASDGDGLITGTGLEILTSSTPAVPTGTDSAIIYTKNRAHRPTPMVVDDMGERYALQPAFFGRSIAMVSPANGTTLSQIGCLFTSTGTVSHPTLSANSLAESAKRYRVTSSATAGNGGGNFHPSTICWRGNTGTAQGGFFMYVRFSLATTAASTRCFVGLTSQITTLAGEPSALPDCIGVGFDAADAGANFQYYQRTGTGTVVKTDCGNNAPRAVNTVYDFYMYCPPGGSSVSMRFVNETSGVAVLNNIELTTFPLSTTFLSPMIMVHNGAVATAVAIDIHRFYLETDY